MFFPTAVLLLGLRVPYRVPAFPSSSRGIVFVEVPYRLPWFVHFHNINESPNTKLNRSNFDFKWKPNY